MATEYYELKINGVCQQERNTCVLAFIGGNLTANDTNNNGGFLTDAWRTNIQALWLACLPSSYYLDNIQARRIITKPSVVTFHQYQAGVSHGTLGTAASGDQICPSIFLIPPSGFTSGGKVFMPAVPENMITNNTYDTSYSTPVLALFAAMATNFGISGKTWELGIFSRKDHTVANVVGVNMSARIGFQKKRAKPV